MSGLVIHRVQQQPTVTAGAYTAADAVGGLLTFAVQADYGIIRGAIVHDLADQDVDYDLVLFRETFTATADNDPFDVADGDLPNVEAVIPITETRTFNDNAVITSPVNTAVPFTTAAGSLFGQLVTRGTPTYVAVTDVRVTLLVEGY